MKSQSGTRLILLDEVTFTKDWERAVKSAIDSGQTQTLVITGSNSNDLRRGADRMPGRYRQGGEYDYSYSLAPQQ